MAARSVAVVVDGDHARPAVLEHGRLLLEVEPAPLPLLLLPLLALLLAADLVLELGPSAELLDLQQHRERQRMASVRSVRAEFLPRREHRQPSRHRGWLGSGPGGPPLTFASKNSLAPNTPTSSTLISVRTARRFRDSSDSSPARAFR